MLKKLEFNLKEMKDLIIMECPICASKCWYNVVSPSAATCCFCECWESINFKDNMIAFIFVERSKVN